MRWTSGFDTSIKHIRLIARGSEEVHEVKLYQHLGRDRFDFRCRISNLALYKTISSSSLDNVLNSLREKSFPVALETMKYEMNYGQLQNYANHRGHPNIVSVFRTGELASSYFYLDMELCDSSLHVWIQNSWSRAYSDRYYPNMTSDVPSREN